MTDEPLVIDKSPMPHETDIVRSVRFKKPIWDKVLNLVELFDRSPNYVINKLVKDFEPAVTIPDAAEDVPGVSTYMLQVEFQTPAKEAADEQAYDLLTAVTDLLRLYSKDDAVYGRIDAIRPMMTRRTGEYTTAVSEIVETPPGS